MFEVIIGNQKYDNKEVESISIYSDEDGLAHAWVSFKIDASKFVGLPIIIGSFTGEVDSVESKTDYICKLYCTGVSSPASLDDKKDFPSTQNSVPTKESKKSKKTKKI